MNLYRVFLAVEYITPERGITAAENWLYEDIMNMVKYNDLGPAIIFEPAPDATLDDVHPLLLSGIDEEE